MFLSRASSRTWVSFLVASSATEEEAEEAPEKRLKKPPEEGAYDGEGDEENRDAYEAEDGDEVGDRMSLRNLGVGNRLLDREGDA